MDAKQMIAARLAEWKLKLSDSEIEQLLPAYEKLLVWQPQLEAMLHSRRLQQE
jgi:hypothetical protein